MSSRMLYNKDIKKIQGGNKNMKTYSAIVKDKYTKKTVIIKNQEHNTKAEFIQTLRKNSYSVNPQKAKESEVFDYIINNTNCYPWDWEINKVPQ